MTDEASPLRAVDILDSVSDGFVSIGPDWRYTYVNAKGAELLGRGGLVGKHYWQEYPEAAGTAFALAYERVMTSRRPETLEDHYEPWDRWFENRIFPTKDGGIAIYFTEITLRKRAERDLVEAEARYRAMVEQGPAVTYVFDLHESPAYITYISPQVESMLGYPSSAWIDDPRFWMSILHPDDRDRVVDEDIRTIQAEEQLLAEYRLLAADGRAVWVRDRAVVVRDRYGVPLVRQGVLFDVTELKESEAERMELARRFEDLMTNVQLIAVMLDVHGRVTLANRFLLQLLDLPEHAVIGSSWFDVIVPDTRPDVRAVFEGAIQAGEIPAHFENEITTSHGEHRLVAWNNTMLRDATGRIVGTASIGEDITALRRSQEEVRLSRERLRTIVDSQPDSVEVVRDDATLLEMNPAGLAMIEADSSAQVIGRSILGIVVPEHRAAFASLTHRIAHGGTGTLQFEIVGLKGTHRWLETHAVPLPGGEQLMLGLTRDITDQRRAEAQLTESERRFRLIAEVTSDYIFTLRSKPDGTPRLEWASDRFVQDFGLTRETMRAADPWAMIFAADAPGLRQELPKILAGATSVGEMRVVRSDGQVRWVRFYVRPEWDYGEGRVTRIHGSLTDVHDRKLALEALRESEARLAGAQRIARLGNWSWEASTDAIEWSDQMYELFGVERGIPLTPTTFLELIHEDDRETMAGWIADALGGAAPPALEFRVVKDDGTVAVVEGAGGPVVGPDGSVSRLLGTALDITERTHARDELRRYATRLTNLNAIHQAILQASSGADLYRRVLLALRELVPFFGGAILAIDEATDVLDILAVVPDDPGPMPAAPGTRVPVPSARIRDALLRGEVVHEPDLAVPANTDADRRLLAAGTRSRLIVPAMAGGRAAAAIGVSRREAGTFTDEEVAITREVADVLGLAITQSRLRDDLARRAEELTNLAEERRLLLGKLVTGQEEERARVSRELHDSLGQTLTALALFAGALEKEQPTPELREKVERYRRRTEEAVVEMRALVSTLRPVELEEGLGPAVRKLALLAMEQGFPVIDVSEDLGGTRFDGAVEATVYRVVQEALTNSVRHARATNLSIVLALREHVLSALVEDDGRGFDADVLPAGHFGVIGMRERATMLGGLLTVDASPDRGTTVRLEVPV